jgi:hypothetical protein
VFNFGRNWTKLLNAQIAPHRGTDREDAMLKKSKTRKRNSPDALLKTRKKGDIELTERELGKVSGGTVKFKFTTTTKDKVDTY